MGLFSLKRKEVEQPVQEMQQTDFQEVEEVVIPKNKFVMEEKPRKTELPIYEVYQRLQEDWES